ncbi:MAG: hydroxymethylbilane synthase [Nitrososphaerota archaeon]|nr:hydroxymethylbilane synthase [Nitrososphaerota archaeon]
MVATRSRLLIGTRGSRLALAQTKIVIDLLRDAARGVELVPVVIRTSGDTLPQERRGGLDGKTAFTGEIDTALVEGRVDISVHSMKDIPAQIDRAIVVAATPVRGDARDALVSTGGARFAELKKGARVGTSSVRRRAQILAARSDLEVVEVHGNVETRLSKLGDGGVDGVVLAAAGLERLNLGGRISQLFQPQEMVPAACQGIIAVETREDDRELTELVRGVDDPRTRAASECERALSEELGGDCDVPLGAYAEVRDGTLTVVGVVADPEGRSLVRKSVTGTADDPRSLGRRLAETLRDSGGRRILEGMRA